MSHFRHLRDHWVSNKLIVIDNSASKIRRTRRMCTQNYLEIGPESRFIENFILLHFFGPKSVNESYCGKIEFQHVITDFNELNQKIT